MSGNSTVRTRLQLKVKKRAEADDLGPVVVPSKRKKRAIKTAVSNPTSEIDSQSQTGSDVTPVATNVEVSLPDDSHDEESSSLPKMLLSEDDTNDALPPVSTDKKTEETSSVNDKKEDAPACDELTTQKQTSLVQKADECNADGNDMQAEQHESFGEPLITAVVKKTLTNDSTSDSTVSTTDGNVNDKEKEGGKVKCDDTEDAPPGKHDLLGEKGRSQGTADPDTDEDPDIVILSERKQELMKKIEDSKKKQKQLVLAGTIAGPSRIETVNAPTIPKLSQPKGNKGKANNLERSVKSKDSGKTKVPSKSLDLFQKSDIIILQKDNQAMKDKIAELEVESMGYKEKIVELEAQVQDLKKCLDDNDNKVFNDTILMKHSVLDLTETMDDILTGHWKLQRDRGILTFGDSNLEVEVVDDLFNNCKTRLSYFLPRLLEKCKGALYCLSHVMVGRSGRPIFDQKTLEAAMSYTKQFVRDYDEETMRTQYNTYRAQHWKLEVEVPPKVEATPAVVMKPCTVQLESIDLTNATDSDSD